MICFPEPGALEGRRELSRGVSEANPRNIAINECAPAGARGTPATPAGVRIVVPLLPGGSLRSPPANFLSPRWGGIRYRIYEQMYLVIFAGLILLPRLLPEVLAQGDSFSKNFKKFPGIASGIDFFARGKADVTAFLRPVADAQQKLAAFLGNDLAKGAIVVCTTAEQRDSVTEARVLKMGYKWALIQLTPEAANEQLLAQMKSQFGGKLPPELLDRMQNQSAEMKSMAESRLVASTGQRVGYAILGTTLAPNTPFRSCRVDDMGRGPLADWLDIGLAAYAAGSPTANLRLLQDRLEEAFPLEDVLSMSRPFVVPGSGGGVAGSQGTIIRMGPGGGPGPGQG